MRDKETNTEPNLEGDSRARKRTMRGRERGRRGVGKLKVEDVGTLIEASQVGQKKIERERKKKPKWKTKRKMKCANGRAGTEQAELVELHIPNLI